MKSRTVVGSAIMALILAFSLSRRFTSQRPAASKSSNNPLAARPPSGPSGLPRAEAKGVEVVIVDCVRNGPDVRPHAPRAAELLDCRHPAARHALRVEDIPTIHRCKDLIERPLRVST